VDTLDPVLPVTNTVIFDGPAITIPASGNASPYPSSVTVTGITAAVTGIRVRLNNLYHNYPQDLDIFLVGGVKTNVSFVMSDVGAANAHTSTLTFVDSAGALLTTSFMTNGVWRPTNLSLVETPPAGSVGPAFTNLNSLLSTAPVAVSSAAAPSAVVSIAGVAPVASKPWRSERLLEVRGIFSLTRIADVPVLTITP
jgi:hypothetical protein